MNEHASNTAPSIDTMMEAASQALACGEYLDAAMACRDALFFARNTNDFGTMSRICLPMLEAQRALRLAALDTNLIHCISKSTDIPADPDASCYLFAPNFVGVLRR